MWGGSWQLTSFGEVGEVGGVILAGEVSWAAKRFLALASEGVASGETAGIKGERLCRTERISLFVERISLFVDRSCSFVDDCWSYYFQLRCVRLFLCM